MHPFFEPLSERETMLLLTTLTVGSSEDVEIFSGLPTESRQRLREKAQALSTIVAEKRVAFIVHEIKQALAFRGLRGVDKIDASWLLQALKGESPRMVATVLVGLPNPIVRSLLACLPPGIRQRLPPREEMKLVHADIVRSVRLMYEARFTLMPQPTAKGFAFRDVIQLERGEIFKLMRDLGLIELGQAFVSMGKNALAELCRRLPRNHAEELILAVRSASQIDLPDENVAQHFLSRVVVNFNDTEELFQKAGLWRLARAASIEGIIFCQAFRQRLPREVGLLFDSFLEQVNEMGDLNEEVIKRIQDLILLRVQYLAERHLVSRRWLETEMLYNNPETIAAVRAENEDKNQAAVEV
ncbi:MAG: hypothetical protein JW841_06690 [Deltaproteobacteria bacterium]|nr:hypothetical protein [Deltaproteobacteria bacterium]